jgi:hypothetical protein
VHNRQHPHRSKPARAGRNQSMGHANSERVVSACMNLEIPLHRKSSPSV